MTIKFGELLKNFFYTISSNFISLIISALAVLFIPRFIGVEEYGYFQLYIFYISYVGILHFGWLDGIYLRFGGWLYSNLNKKEIHNQLVQFVVFQAIVAIIISVLVFSFSTGHTVDVLLFTIVAMLLINVTQFFQYILQDTNRIKEYSITVMTGRVVYIIMVILAIILKFSNFKTFIICDILGKVVSLVFSMYFCSDLIFIKTKAIFSDFSEAFHNISIGIKLLIANFAGLLVTGIVRYGIKLFWGIKIFGKVSLTLNISNLLMTFISAISLVLYPTFRRLDEEKLKKLYNLLSEMLNVILFLGLFLYYPLNWILPIWLPKYSDSLVYMSILFPMCVYSGKFSLLIITFMKTFRLERELLQVNLWSLVISAVTTIFFSKVIHNLSFLMFGIVFILFMQCLLGDIVIGKKLNIETLNKIIPETMVVIVFTFSNWFLGSGMGFILYLASLIIYVYYYRFSIKQAFIAIKANMTRG